LQFLVNHGDYKGRKKIKFHKNQYDQKGHLLRIFCTLQPIWVNHGLWTQVKYGSLLTIVLIFFEYTIEKMGKQVPFTYSNHTSLLDIPSTISINEHTYRLLDQWHLPVFVFPSI
jgi:hypothetical protein